MSRWGQSGCHWASPSGAFTPHSWPCHRGAGKGRCPQMPELALPACGECLGIRSPMGQPSASYRRANTPSLDPRAEQLGGGACLSSETHDRTWLHTLSSLRPLPLPVPCHTPGLPGSIHSKLTCMRVLVSPGSIWGTRPRAQGS